MIKVSALLVAIGQLDKDTKQLLIEHYQDALVMQEHAKQDLDYARQLAIEEASRFMQMKQVEKLFNTLPIDKLIATLDTLFEDTNYDTRPIYEYRRGLNSQCRYNVKQLAYDIGLIDNKDQISTSPIAAKS